METNNNQPGPGLLDDAEQAAPFDMDGMIDEASGTQKQQYDRVFVDPETELGVDDPMQPTAAMGARARRATAEALMMMADRAQAGIFTLFGAKGHADDFRFSKADRAEMVTHLADGIPDNWQLPWWVPFSVLFSVALGGNFTKLQEIKAEKKRVAEEERNRKAREEREASQQDQQLQDLRQQRDERRQANTRRTAPAPPQPAAPSSPADFDPNAPVCEECQVVNTVNGNRFCSAKCRGQANGRKATAVNKKRAGKG